MSSDCSSTEGDDSFFDLYSTKNVISKYYSVLEKLKSSSSENEVVVYEQDDATGEKGKEKNKTDKSSKKITFSRNSPNVVVLDDSPITGTSVEESRGTRRSARLTNKRNNTNVAACHSAGVETRNRKRTGKQRKKNSEVVIIDDEKGKDCGNLNPTLDDEVNYEVSVKVIWKSVSVETFHLRRFQKFTPIFEHFMKEENVPMEKLLFTLNNRKIQSNDTPDSVDLKVYEFIEGGVLSNSVSNSNKTMQSQCSNEKDSILVKVQDEAKNIFKFRINKNESFKSVMIRYAEQIEVPLHKIKFYFDGEVLNSSETPISLGLDNDEIIDVKLIE